MNRTPRIICGSLLAIAAFAATTSCDPYPAGPAGRVVARNQKHDPATHSTRFELTVQGADGSKRTFQVDVDDFDQCPADTSYPG